MTTRGFSTAEFKSRVANAQTLMAQHGLAALLLTTEPEVRYFTGYLTRFWESPSRPWFLIVPAVGTPVAVIPSIGAALMARTWITDIRTWRSPNPVDEGIGLLTETLIEMAGKDGRIGVPDGPESHLRLPLSDWAKLTNAVPMLGGDHGVMEQLRIVKSSAEVAKIKQACSIADNAFARVPEIAREGAPLEKVFREFQSRCLSEGADWVPYLAGASNHGGYTDVISPATDAPLTRGDVLMLDTGLVWDGYFCDFDRNFSIGKPSQMVADAHKVLIDATRAAFDIAKPEMRACDLFHAMDRIVTGGQGGSDAGRLGHGLGMQLTEWPSLTAGDQTVLKPGMVLTLEPGIEMSPTQTMVHEENIVITGTGAEFLSTPASPEILVIEA